MTAIEILRQFSRLGIYFEHTGDTLRATGSTSALTAEDKTLIRNSKTAILDFLKACPRFNVAPTVPLYSPFVPGAARHNDLLLFAHSQKPSVMSWLHSQSAMYKGKQRSWDLPDCEYTAMQDLSDWQYGKR